MSHKYAIVKNEVVTNLVEWDGASPFNVDGELIPATDDAWIGGAYTNNAFVPMYTQEELDQMEAEAIAKKEAIEAIRASALQKLVENAGLTVEEVKSFLKVEEQ